MLLFFNYTKFQGIASPGWREFAFCLGGENSLVWSSGTQISLYLRLAKSCLRQDMTAIPNSPSTWARSTSPKPGSKVGEGEDLTLSLGQGWARYLWGQGLMLRSGWVHHLPTI